MPRKEIVDVKLAAPNPNLSPATRFGNLVFVSGQTGRHPVTGEVGKDIREQTRNILEHQADPGRRRHVARQRADRDDLCHQAGRRARLQRGVREVLSEQQAGPHHRDGGVAELARAADRDHGHRLHPRLIA